MIRMAGLEGSVAVKQSSLYTRPTAVPYLIADVSRFTDKTGWTVQKSFDDILLDTLEYWDDNHARVPSWNVDSRIAPSA
jgi:nucleoside-diphosphate-sugar epimerase